MTGDELREIMKEHGWTQSDLARHLPLKSPRSTRTIRYWLSGDREIREVFAHRIRSLAAEAGREP